MGNPPVEKLPDVLSFEITVNNCACLFTSIKLEREISDDEAKLLFSKIGESIASMFKKDDFLHTVKQALANKIASNV